MPVRAFMEMGYEKNVVILTRPADYRKKPEKTGIAGIFYKRYPKFVEKLVSRSDKYNEMVADIEELEKEGKIFVIRPETPLDIGRMCHDADKICRAYERGRKDGQAYMKKMMEWLNV